MGTYLKRTNFSPFQVGTTTLLTVGTGSATLFTMGTGFSAIHFTNISSSQLVWGDSSLSAGSGAILDGGESQSFENLADNFTVYFRAASYQAVVAVNQFRA